jgi:heme/copper-type cytochrome/quinol oxidase subunit 2
MGLLVIYLTIGILYAMQVHGWQRKSFDETAEKVGYWQLVLIHYGVISVFWPVFVITAIIYRIMK